jgi:hypothetical protein
LTNHWSIRIGFLHTEFGRLSAFGFCMMAFRLIFRTLPTMLAILTASTVSFGANYKF